MATDSVVQGVEEFRRRCTSGLVTLLFTDIIGSTRIKDSLGDREGVAIIQAHHACVRRLLGDYPDANEISTAGDSFLILFSTPSEAVRLALRLQSELRSLDRILGQRIRDRIGIHVGEVVIERSVGMPHPREVYGLQVDICNRVMSLGGGDQVLLTRTAFDNARQMLKGESLPNVGKLAWQEYGRYPLKGVSDEIEICEVGEVGHACLRAPKRPTKPKLQKKPAREAHAQVQLPLTLEPDKAGERQPQLTARRTTTADLNGDGAPELVLADSEGFLAVWSVQGTQVGSTSFMSPNNVGDSGWQLVGTPDFNADGRPDLLFQHSDGSLAVWEMEGIKLKRAIFLNPAETGAPEWRVVGTRKSDGGARWQMFFQHVDGSLAVWLMDGVNMTKIEPLRPGDSGVGWRVMAVSDLFGDGNTDLVLQHIDGSLAVWHLNNLSQVGVARLGPGDIGDAAWRVAASMDLDGDHKSDLILQHKDGLCAAWFMDGIRLRRAEVFQPGNPGGSWKVVGPK